MKEWIKEFYMYLLGAVIVLGEILMIIWIITIWQMGISTENDNVINLVYGLCLAYHSAFMLVVGFFYGSSKGSADKTKILTNGNNPKE